MLYRRAVTSLLAEEEIGGYGDRSEERNSKVELVVGWVGGGGLSLRV
jgi:hypothetical protein